MVNCSWFGQRVSSVVRHWNELDWRRDSSNLLDDDEIIITMGLFTVLCGRTRYNRPKLK